MKLCTTSVLEGWPSNNQSKAPKWAFRTAKNQFILLELPHSMGFDFYCSNFCEVRLERTTMPQPFKEILSTYTWFYWNSVWKRKSESVHRRVEGKKENTLPLIKLNCNCSLRSKKILDKRISLLPLGLPLFHHEVKLHSVQHSLGFMGWHCCFYSNPSYINCVQSKQIEISKQESLFDELQVRRYCTRYPWDSRMHICKYTFPALNVIK